MFGSGRARPQLRGRPPTPGACPRGRGPGGRPWRGGRPDDDVRADSTVDGTSPPGTDPPVRAVVADGHTDLASRPLDEAAANPSSAGEAACRRRGGQGLQRGEHAGTGRSGRKSREGPAAPDVGAGLHLDEPVLLRAADGTRIGGVPNSMWPQIGRGRTWSRRGPCPAARPRERAVEPGVTCSALTA